MADVHLRHVRLAREQPLGGASDDPQPDPHPPTVEGSAHLRGCLADGWRHGLRDLSGLWPHPSSGSDSLLYIGKANDQTFSRRFKNHHLLWNPDSDDGLWEDNTALLRFFTARVHATQQDECTIDDELWGKYIDIAEKLLICANKPPWNGQGVSGINTDHTDAYDDCHVLNWGTHASLLPEVSGFRHLPTEDFNQICDDPLAWTASQAG